MSWGNVASTSISECTEDYERKIHCSKEDATLDWMIERLVIVPRRNLEIRNYARALMNIYFSTDVTPEIRQAIHDITADSHEPWINPDHLISMLVRSTLGSAGSGAAMALMKTRPRSGRRLHQGKPWPVSRYLK